MNYLRPNLSYVVLNPLYSGFDILDLWLPDFIISSTYNLFFLCHHEFKNLS